ncbi:protein kinase domain-containing protein [Streptomyces californicus]|uniref:protein kinase domain-containing protein n=1 Tax=Streptomyces californicus TaxID=67351 RepID=UPI001E4E54B0|nr:protein kinase [Streptomyces californicus]
MAPEAFSGTFGPRSDVYSLGCLLYEMLTGRRPFTGTSWHLINQHLNENPPPLRALRPDVPVDLETFTGRLLAKDPADHPTSGQVRSALHLIHDRAFGDSAPRRGEDVSRARHRRGGGGQAGCDHPGAGHQGEAVPGLRDQDGRDGGTVLCDVRGRGPAHPVAAHPPGTSPLRDRGRAEDPPPVRAASPARTAVRPATSTSPCTSPADQPVGAQLRGAAA